MRVSGSRLRPRAPGWPVLARLRGEDFFPIRLTDPAFCPRAAAPSHELLWPPSHVTHPYGLKQHRSTLSFSLFRRSEPSRGLPGLKSRCWQRWRLWGGNRSPCPFSGAGFLGSRPPPPSSGAGAQWGKRLVRPPSGLMVVFHPWTAWATALVNLRKVASADVKKHGIINTAVAPQKAAHLSGTLQVSGCAGKPLAPVRCAADP